MVIISILVNSKNRIRMYSLWKKETRTSTAAGKSLCIVYYVSRYFVKSQLAAKKKKHKL